MSQAPGRPLPATVEEFDEDQGRSKPETRQSAKRPTSHQPRRRSEVNVSHQKHPDIASDSGYSSHTHSTNISVDVPNAISAVRAPSPPKVVIIDSPLPSPATDASQPSGPQGRISVPTATSTSKDPKRRAFQSDPKEVKGIHHARNSADKQLYPQTPADHCRDPACNCSRRYPAGALPSNRSLNAKQEPFDDLRYSYHQHAYQQPSSSTSVPVGPLYPGTGPGYASASSARPSLRTRSRPASYHTGYGYSYYPESHVANAGPAPSSSRSYAQYAQYYQYPTHYAGDSASAAPYYPLSTVTGSPQSPPAYNARPNLQHAITDTLAPRTSTQYHAPIITHGLTSEGRPFPVGPLSAGAYTHRDQTPHNIRAYFDDGHEQPRRADDARSRTSADLQMPPPILRRSSTRRIETSSPALQPLREPDRSHSSRSRSRTDAGVTRRTYYRYTYEDSENRQDADRPKRDRRELPSNRTRQPSVSTATSGHDRSSTYPSDTGGGMVVEERERQKGRRTTPLEYRDRPLYQTRQASHDYFSAQAEEYQARVRGADDPAQITTERIARARGRSPSSSRPIIPQPTEYQPRSVVSNSSGHKSRHSSKRHSMDGSRVSRTDTGEIRIRMDQGTSIRLDDRKIRIENNEIIIGNVGSGQQEAKHHYDDGVTRASDRYHSRSGRRSRAESEVRGRRHSRARSIMPNEREQRR